VNKLLHILAGFCGTVLLPLLLSATGVETVITEGPYLQRLHTIRKLSAPLHPNQAHELVRFLNTPGNGSFQEVQENNTLRNEVTAYLIQTRQELDALAESLLSSWKREGENTVWLDYTLQHAGAGLPHFSESHQKQLIEFLRSKTNSHEENYAGTALLSLNRNSPALVDPKEIIETSRLVLQDTKQVPANQTTALQLLANFNDPIVLPTARDWASRQEKITFSQKLCALRILVKNGDNADEELLKAYQTHPNRLLRKVASQAVPVQN
jgi:hypothetical protein